MTGGGTRHEPVAYMAMVGCLHRRSDVFIQGEIMTNSKETTISGLSLSSTYIPVLQEEPQPCEAERTAREAQSAAESMYADGLRQRAEAAEAALKNCAAYKFDQDLQKAKQRAEAAERELSALRQASAEPVADALHIAICQAVGMMNMGDWRPAHIILRKALIAYADHPPVAQPAQPIASLTVAEPDTLNRTFAQPAPAVPAETHVSIPIYPSQEWLDQFANRAGLSDTCARNYHAAITDTAAAQEGCGNPSTALKPSPASAAARSIRDEIDDKYSESVMKELRTAAAQAIPGKVDVRMPPVAPAPAASHMPHLATETWCHVCNPSAAATTGAWGPLAGSQSESPASSVTAAAQEPKP